MEDLTYQEVIQAEIGEWPTDEEKAAIKDGVNESIDNDPRPPSAKPAEDFY